jgi:hypothetical protein
MTTQHTKGPWVAASRDGEPWVENEDGDYICAPHGYDFDEDLANAKLIAAAPDLLAACEALLFAIEQDKVRGLGRCIDVASAAIAMATS